MFTVLNKEDNTSHVVNDLKKEIEILYPKGNKHCHNYIMAKIAKDLIINTPKFTLMSDAYNPTNISKVVSKGLVAFKNVPKNKSKVKNSKNYNQWIMMNSLNGRSCIFNNLAEVARCINVDYQYLYSGINNNSVFEIGKYYFSRNSMSEKDHVMYLLSEVL